MPSNIIQWFPGHMAKTRRIIKECLPSVDIVLEILDARIPMASQNPELSHLISSKPRLTLLAKCSLSDPRSNDRWREYFNKNGRKCLFIDSITGTGINNIAPEIKNILSDKIERNEKKGVGGRPLRAMVVGIPNVGKSSLINRLCGAKKAKVEDRPGVTLTKQWIKTDIGIDLLDMPGVLWPKFDDQSVGESLAMTGAVKDEITDTEELAIKLVGRLRALYPDLLCQRYKLGDYENYADLQDWELFEKIGAKRGFLISRGEVDFTRTSSTLLDEFRSAKIGRITLEEPK